MLSTTQYPAGWTLNIMHMSFFVVYLATPVTVVAEWTAKEDDLALEEQFTQADDTLAEDGKELYREEIYPCGYEANLGAHTVSGHKCPSHAPTPFSKVFKYPHNYVGKSSFCNNRAGSRHIPEFCEGEILQLQLKMPKDLSNQTGFQTNWVENGNLIPFFCPPEFRTYVKPHGGTQACISQLCRGIYAIHPDDTKYEHTVGTFFTVNDIWVLNLKLRESPGHKGLSIRLISCPDADPSISYRSCIPCPCKHCCWRETRLDIRIVAGERNDFKSPATAIGNGLFNVTILKKEQYVDLNVTDTKTGESVDFIETGFGLEERTVMLKQGVFQVSGSTNHTCGSLELASPIILLPLNATLNQPKFIDFSLRKLSWQIDSNLPVIRYVVYPQADESMSVNTTSHAVVFTIAGGEYESPAPAEQTFVHKILYDGIDEQNWPSQHFIVNLTDFLPTDIAVSYNDTHTDIQWQQPKSHQDGVKLYCLKIDGPLTNSEKTCDIDAGNRNIQHFTFNRTHPYHVGEMLNITLSAVYKNTDDDAVYWWGPEATRSVYITETPTHSLLPSASTTRMSSVTSATASASPAASPRDNELGIIVGASLAGAGVLVVSVTGLTVVLYFCGKKVKTMSYRLNSPVLDKPSI